MMMLLLSRNMFVSRKPQMFLATAVQTTGPTPWSFTLAVLEQLLDRLVLSLISPPGSLFSWWSFTSTSCGLQNIPARVCARTHTHLDNLLWSQETGGWFSSRWWSVINAWSVPQVNVYLRLVRHYWSPEARIIKLSLEAFVAVCNYL